MPAYHEIARTLLDPLGPGEKGALFSPDGSAIVNEPARGGVYSFGAGIDLGNIFIDMAYEYAVLKYQDIYQSNANYNTRQQHQVMVECAYRF